MIPYLCILIFIGRPLYFLELAMGQFSSKSSVKVWDLSPIFRGMYCMLKHSVLLFSQLFSPQCIFTKLIFLFHNSENIHDNYLLFVIVFFRGWLRAGDCHCICGILLHSTDCFSSILLGSLVSKYFTLDRL